MLLIIVTRFSFFVQSHTFSFSLSILHTSFSYVIIFLRHFSQTTISVKISNFLICVYRFELPCPIHEKDNFIENVYIVLSCLIKIVFIFNLVCFEPLSYFRRHYDICNITTLDLPEIMCCNYE